MCYGDDTLTFLLLGQKKIFQLLPAHLIPVGMVFDENQGENIVFALVFGHHATEFVGRFPEVLFEIDVGFGVRHE